LAQRREAHAQRQELRQHAENADSGKDHLQGPFVVSFGILSGMAHYTEGTGLQQDQSLGRKGHRRSRFVDRQVISKQRVADHGEVFTPAKLVNDMLNLPGVVHECERIDSRFLEPACGNGNFLTEVLRRKLLTVDKRHARNRDKWERDAILCVCSLYGIDLLPDNIAECRARLLDVVNAAHEARFKAPLPEEAVSAASFILSKNIVQGDALSFRNAEGRAIVFPEWSPLNGNMLKRRDFAYDHLLEQAHIASTPLFSDLGKDVYLPTPVGEFPPCHYLKVPDVEAKQ